MELRERIRVLLQVVKRYRQKNFFIAFENDERNQFDIKLAWVMKILNITYTNIQGRIKYK